MSRPASSPASLKRYSNNADATVGLVMIWVKQLHRSPQVIPRCWERIRSVEPPPSVVVTIPVSRFPRNDSDDNAQPKPCPSSMATT